LTGFLIVSAILIADKDPADPKPVNQVKDFYKDCVDLGKSTCKFSDEFCNT
jgi:hypothetical protein